MVFLVYRRSKVLTVKPQAIDSFGSNVDIDLQQRGVEFGQLFRSQAGIRGQILEPMPAMERNKNLDRDPVTTSTSSSSLLETGPAEVAALSLPPAETNSTLIDLLGLGDPAPTESLAAGLGAGGLGDILGLGGLAPAPTTTNLLDGLGGLSLGPPVAPGPPPSTNGGLDSLLNGVDTAAFVTPTSDSPSLVAYERHGLRVVFTFPTNSASAITLLAHNLTASPIQEFVFQVD